MRRQRLGERFEAGLGHRAPVFVRIVLSDGQRLPISIESPGSLVEPSQIAIRQSPIEPLGLLSCALDEVFADGRAEGAAAAVQHQPHAVRLVEAQFDEVVPASERAERQAPRLVELPPAFRHLGRSLEHSSDPALQCSDSGPGAAPWLRVPREADRYPRLDCIAHRAQVVRQLAGLQVKANCVHTAPDVDADRGGNDRPARRDHAPHRGAATVVHVRHRCDVRMGDGQAGHVLQLLERLAPGGVGPQLHRHTLRRCLERHLNGHHLNLSLRIQREAELTATGTGRSPGPAQTSPRPRAGPAQCSNGPSHRSRWEGEGESTKQYSDWTW